jgi:cytoskeletal protein CcmA (bactofilin family)
MFTSTPKKVHHYEEGVVETLIGEQTRIEGSIHSQGSLRIEGAVKGEVHAQGEAFIGEKSHIEGAVFARRVVVAGEVKGNIETVNGLEISATGKVYGDITGDRLTIEEGAIYKGNVNMDVISPKKMGHRPAVSQLSPGATSVPGLQEPSRKPVLQTMAMHIMTNDKNEVTEVVRTVK